MAEATLGAASERRVQMAMALASRAIHRLRLSHLAGVPIIDEADHIVREVRSDMDACLHNQPDGPSAVGSTRGMS